MIEIIYIGEKFYSQSGTLMSSIYYTDGGRSDWGKVNLALKEGKEVHIRPATAQEFQHFQIMLDRIKNDSQRLD